MPYEVFRDLIGYADSPPDPQWPGGARLALVFVVNYQEGGERTVLNGDDGPETRLTGLADGPCPPGGRDPAAESRYEYGSRVGFWRLMRLFAAHRLTVTCNAVGLALERNPAAARAMIAAGHEIAAHGYRWEDHRTLPEEVERDHVRRAVAGIERVAGQRPLGWQAGRPGGNTRRLVVEEGGFLYDSDACNDELPYWVQLGGRPHLVIPDMPDTSDAGFAATGREDDPDAFLARLRDTFDVLYREAARWPRMMSVGLHPRLAGRPACIAALERFLDHVRRHERVWLCRRIDIARHWHQHHPFQPD